MAIALDRVGFDVAEFVHRGDETANVIAKLLRKTPRLTGWNAYTETISDVVLITSGDPDIAAIGDRLAEIGGNGVVLHTSGSLSSDVLATAREQGYRVGSMHPLISISDPVAGAESFSGAYFCVEGDVQAVAVASQIAEALGSSTFSIPTRDKPLYHAAAVTACGHLVALIDIAVEMLSKCGLESDEAKCVLFPLVESTITNLRHQASENALTGSFARGDSEAVERHLLSFEGRISDEIRSVYLELGNRSVEIASRLEPGSERPTRLAEFISLAKQNSGC